jgi:hypothetical protein
MSLRRIDVRFVLPRLPRRAVVFGLDDWSAALREAGVDVDQGAKKPDLAVAPQERAGEAVSSGAATVILEGRDGSRRLRSAGFMTRSYLPLPALEDPDLIVPLGAGSRARYVLQQWRPAATLAKRARNSVAGWLAERGIMPGRPRYLVGARQPGPPLLIAAAAELGIPPSAAWFLTLGQGDELTRAVFHLFSPGVDRPEWVLKFARIPDFDKPFRRDEAGLTLAASAGEAVSAHAPRLLGRFEAASHHASIETAAVGERLSTLLARSPLSSRAAVDEIAGWIVEMGRVTAASASALAEERRRLERHVLPAWGADRELVHNLPELTAVLQHNDLGSWNIVWEAQRKFIAVDWESARRHGLPLWDLLYFLIDVLPQLDGARSAEDRASGALRLLRGEAPSSGTLFSWIRTAVEQHSLPPDSVGPIATLCWLHHGLSHRARGEATLKAGGRPAELPPAERIAPVWLADPALGPQWDRWRS